MIRPPLIAALVGLSVLAAVPAQAEPAAAAGTAPQPTASAAATTPMPDTPKPRTVRIGERTVAVGSIAEAVGDASTRSVRAPADSSARKHPR